MALEKRLRNLRIIKASVLLFTPLILICITGEIRPSISDYAYSNYKGLFVMLLTIAGMLYLNNSITAKQYHNGFLGLSLLGVALTPHLHYPILHYGFAVFFFLGSVFVMIYFSSAEQRLYKIIAGAVIVYALVSIYTHGLSILIAEWIGIVPISIHFIGEKLNIID